MKAAEEIIEYLRLNGIPVNDTDCRNIEDIIRGRELKTPRKLDYKKWSGDVDW